MPDAIARLVNFSDAKALFTDEDIWEELKNQSLPQVESVICLEDWVVLGGKKGEFNKSSLPLREELEVGFPKSSPDSLAMICFTSGSTGGAKGVMFSVLSLSAGLDMVCDSYPVSHNHNVLSILPFAHVLAFGGTIAT